jgi:hypothetical protein
VPPHIKHFPEKQKPKEKRDIRECTRYLIRNRHKNERSTEENRMREQVEAHHD